MDEATEQPNWPCFRSTPCCFPARCCRCIFEDRYRLMIRRCLADERRSASLLIKQGEEVSADAGRTISAR